MKIGLVGRTNVGKSTLFNRLKRSYRAIVTDIPGTTREIFSDQIYLGDGKNATLMDSPGLEKFKDEKKYLEQIIVESDIILFVIDGKQGLVASDEEIKDMIIKNNKKDNCILVINKLDGKLSTDVYDEQLADYYSIGVRHIVGISAKQNHRTQTLIENLIELALSLDINFDKYEPEDFIPIAIMGRPNVGKSTLLNTLSQKEIARVEDVLGTTLDYITSDIIFKKQKYRLYDTAGIRKKGRIHGLEKIALEKTIKVLEYHRPVTVVLIDAEQGLAHRDMSLIGDIIKLEIPMMIAVNKIDKIDKSGLDGMFKILIAQFKFVKRTPIVPISAVKGKGLEDLMKFVKNIREENTKEISTSKLNSVINKAWIQNPPRFNKNKICKFYYMTQTGTNPPRFKIFINKKKNLNFAFRKWVENVIRKNFGFIGVPMVIEFKEKSSDSGKS